MKKELQKKLSFILFVMSVFFAGVALTVFSSSVLVICIAGVLLLGATVFFVLQQETKSQSPTEKTTEILLADRMAELMRGNEKAEKGVYIAVKKQHEAMEAGLTSLEEKISELIKAQDNAVKTLVLYNKENAKQIALSERDELGRLKEALMQTQQSDKGNPGSMSQVVDAVKDMSHRLYEEFHENGEAMLSELEASADSLEEIKELLRNVGSIPVPQQVPPVPTTEELFTGEGGMAFEEDLLPEEEETEEDAMTDEIFIPEVADVDTEMLLFPEEEPAEPEEPEPVIEEPVVAEDPNRMLSADDIAALFAAAEPKEEEPVVAAEPVEEPVVAEEVPETKNPEDALASSGVDLSDPNKTLSPDDIAALIAALGN